MILDRVLAASAAILLLTGAATATRAQPDGVERARLVDVLPLNGELFHVQGMDLDARHIWVTSVDTREHRGYIHQFDRRSGKFERRLEIIDGVRYHPGGMAMHGGSIWVPVAEYRANSSAVLVEIDKKTLTIRRKISVADHIGCVAASGRGLVAGNWDSRLLYVFNRRGRQVRVIQNPSPTRYQDMKFEQGRLVGSGALGPKAGAIDWFAWPSMTLMDSRAAGATDRGVRYTEEGMALQGRDLYLVPEDGPSRMFRFKLTGR
ncbi:DUF6454 family protein [Caulobacter sp. RL271]|uniref:DUF6454 family protein n=1 Tax=Caulobacter segnis TaxID=88688 RepID=A0ABY5A034_9CAUL|nr:DUF6454 family protein [Caulobacter segnis]USQ98110.1 DUF6454 family protein [Caulobacter segnis]